MNAYRLKGTELSLDIELNKEQGVFLFSGKSRPENAFTFYEDVFNWFDEYEKYPNEDTNIQFKLDYFNSSSAKVFLQLLVRFERLVANNIKLKVTWHYKEFDEDILESGEEFDSLVNIPFEYKMY